MKKSKSLIDPRCKKEPGAFIEFTGLITPCCWLISSSEKLNRLKEFMGEDYDNIFIHNSKETIQKAYQKLEQSWDSDSPFKTCLETCRRKQK